jgi:hypothetical protein
MKACTNIVVEETSDELSFMRVSDAWGDALGSVRGDGAELPKVALELLWK